MRIIALLILLIFSPFLIMSQNESVGINTNNPANSAILDVVSNNKGVLIPRMSSAQRTSISGPVGGLLVYDNTTNSFWYYEGGWIEIASSTSSSMIADSDNDTQIQTEESADEDIIRFDIAGTEKFLMRDSRIEPVNAGNSVFLGINAGQNDDLSDNRNVFLGTLAGRQNTSGQNNIAIGYRSFQNNTTGASNIAIGEDAARANTTGSDNIAIGANALNSNQTSSENFALGYNALQDFTSGTGNLAVGHQSLQNLTTGSDNVSLGSLSLQNNLTGSNNVAIGREAGQNATGSGNVFIGYRAGENETGSNKLYIENSNSATPLIWGDFNTDSVAINGDFRVSNDITYVGTITDVSDRRLKSDIKELGQVLPKVLQLKGYSYYMKGDESKQREYGLMAQDIIKQFPYAVKTIDKENGFLGVSYMQLVPILYQALGEQQEIINEQMNQLEEAERRMIQLGNQLDELIRSKNDQ